MPAPRGARHDLIITREYSSDPTDRPRVVAALVKLLERGDAAARLAAQQQKQEQEKKEAIGEP